LTKHKVIFSLIEAKSFNLIEDNNQYREVNKSVKGKIKKIL
jgi:hypothetical protein